MTTLQPISSILHSFPSIAYYRLSVVVVNLLSFFFFKFCLSYDFAELWTGQSVTATYTRRHTNERWSCAWIV